MRSETDRSDNGVIGPVQTGEGQDGYRGRTWDTAALQRDFEVLGFAAHFVVVRGRNDRKLGSLEFTPSPRVYFGWREDS